MENCGSFKGFDYIYIYIYIYIQIDLSLKKYKFKMLTWKIVGALKVSVIYIYIDLETKGLFGCFFFFTQFPSLITLKYPICLASSLTCHHLIFFTLFVGSIPVTRCRFFFLVPKLTEPKNKKKEKKKPKLIEPSERRRKKKVERKN